jgi:molybdopterin-guanine dinucleotide biosynthesis protein A
MTAIVLAGGRSRRLGRDKAQEIVGGQSLIQRVIERLSVITDDILIVTASKDQLPDSALKGVETVFDSYPAKGALVGLYSGLKESNSNHSLVVGCDMPFLNIELLRHLESLAADFDVVIPRVNRKLEPLHAVYSKNCIAPIEAKLHQGNLKISDFIDAVKVRYVEQEEIDKFDPHHLSFLNVNSEADLKRATTMIEKGSA